MTSQRVGLIGLGNMGRPMGKNLLAKGIDLTVYDISHESMATLAMAGARKSRSPEDLASQCSVVILMLPGPQEVEKVCLGEQGVIHGAKEGTIVIDMTSSLPSLTRSIHGAFSEKGIKMIDAPVSGMVKGAVEATLSIMVGGDEAVLDKVRSLLEMLGKSIHPVGPIGSGHLMKAVNNFLVASHMAGTAEAIALAIRGGIDPLKALSVLQMSSGNSFAAYRTFPDLIFPGKPSGYACSILLKDIGIFMKVSQELEVPTFLANLVYSLWSIPEGKEDGTEFFKLYEDWFKVKMKGIVKGD
jgi:3-hydroxyisobutyrate dehydrogenase-like beta-hydroxyacid dehydrogenase